MTETEKLTETTELENIIEPSSWRPGRYVERS